MLGNGFSYAELRFRLPIQLNKGSLKTAYMDNPSTFPQQTRYPIFRLPIHLGSLKPFSNNKMPKITK